VYQQNSSSLLSRSVGVEPEDPSIGEGVVERSDLSFPVLDEALHDVVQQEIRPG
jgi:hypothetical protein